LYAENVTFDAAPGYAGSITRYFGRDAHDFDWYGEAGFWGLNNWKTVASVSAAGTPRYERLFNVTTAANGAVSGNGIVTDSLDPSTTFYDASVFVNGLNGANQLTETYNSNFASAEFNLKIVPRSRPNRLVLYPNGEWHRESQPGWCLSYLVGFRYFHLDEQFTLNGTGEYIFFDFVQPPGGGIQTTPIGTATANGELLIHTASNMYGIQFGGDLMYHDTAWKWGVRYKVAPLVDVVDRTEHVASLSDNQVSAPNFFVSSEDHKTHVAALTEVGLVGSYKIRPNLSVQAAYDVNWLFGAALAPKQGFQNTNPLFLGVQHPIDTSSVLFFQGLTLGLEWAR
jgi:hypothetical protein